MLFNRLARAETSGERAQRRNDALESVDFSRRAKALLRATLATRNTLHTHTHARNSPTPAIRAMETRSVSVRVDSLSATSVGVSGERHNCIRSSRATNRKPRNATHHSTNYLLAYHESMHDRSIRLRSTLLVISVDANDDEQRANRRVLCVEPPNCRNTPRAPHHIAPTTKTISKCQQACIYAIDYTSEPKCRTLSRSAERRQCSLPNTTLAEPTKTTSKPCATAPNSWPATTVE
jgi:hypothetical protein